MSHLIFRCFIKCCPSDNSVDGQNRNADSLAFMYELPRNIHVEQFDIIYGKLYNKYNRYLLQVIGPVMFILH